MPVSNQKPMGISSASKLVVDEMKNTQKTTGQQTGLWQDGWFLPAQRIESPNQDARAPDTVVDLVVIHAISLPPGHFGGPAVAQLFSNQLNPDEHAYFAEIAHLKVSAHFFIRRDGALIQFVPVTARAWHAGVSSWQGRERCNDFSVGIELEGDDETPFEAAQYATLQSLLKALATELPIKAVTSHSHVAPGRKTDPGPCFDWAYVRQVCPDLTIAP
jgi:AmpD protein